MEEMNKKEIKLNIHGKIAKAKYMLQCKQYSSTGRNNHSNYNYFELKDFIPYINEILNEVGLNVTYNFTLERAQMLINSTDSDEVVIHEVPFVMASLPCKPGMNNDIQSYGATLTYLRRYLYLLAFEIVEQDIVERERKQQQSRENSKLLDNEEIKNKLTIAAQEGIESLRACYKNLKSTGNDIDVKSEYFIKIKNQAEEITKQNKTLETNNKEGENTNEAQSRNNDGDLRNNQGEMSRGVNRDQQNAENTDEQTDVTSKKTVAETYQESGYRKEMVSRKLNNNVMMFSRGLK